jgi:hypothetical protein
VIKPKKMKTRGGSSTMVKSKLSVSSSSVNAGNSNSTSKGTTTTTTTTTTTIATTTNTPTSTTGTASCVHLQQENQKLARRKQKFVQQIRRRPLHEQPSPARLQSLLADAVIPPAALCAVCGKKLCAACEQYTLDDRRPAQLEPPSDPLEPDSSRVPASETEPLLRPSNPTRMICCCPDCDPRIGPEEAIPSACLCGFSVLAIVVLVLVFQVYAVVR